MKKSFFYCLAFLLIISCDKDAQTTEEDEEDPQESSEEISDNTVVILQENSTLNSTQEELDNGIYRITFNDTPPELSLGDVIVGDEGMGYLRKVTSIAVNGNNVVLETTQAKMEEVFGNLSFSLTSDLEGLEQQENSKTKERLNYEFFAKGVSRNVKSKFNLDDVIINSNASASISISDGSLTFDPNFEYNWEFEKFKLETFDLKTEDALLNAQITFNLNAEAETTIEPFEYTLYKNSKTIVRPAGGIPVVITTFLKIKAITEVQTLAKFDASKKLEHNTVFSLGATYENNDWNTISSLESGFIKHPVSLEGTYANFNQTIYIVPEVIIALYGINTVEIEPVLSGELGLKVGVTEDWDTLLNGKMDLNLGLGVGVLGKNLTTLPLKSMEVYEETLWNAPDTLKIESGNDQTAVVGQELEEPLRLKVEDSSEQLALKDVQVYFEVTEGGGSVDSEVVKTNENGIAEAIWTLGDFVGEQTVKATIKDAEGNVINEVFIKANSEIGNAFKVAENGVTIEAKSGIPVGTKAFLNEVEYTLVDNELLRTLYDEGEDLSKVVTTLVTNMGWLFRGNNDFNQDISSWDTSNVREMDNMFQGATSFNYNISNWDTANVTDMSWMFDGASSFNQDISSWDISNVIDMTSMFDRATNFNQDISGWNTSNVTDMSRVFNGATSFNQDISTWDTGNVTDMSGMFGNASNFNQDISSWDTSNVTSLRGMFSWAISFNQDISTWDTGNVTDMYGLFFGITGFNQDISGWNTSKVTNISYLFYNATSFNQDISSWDTGNVINMTHSFDGATSFNQDISSWNTANVTDMSHMFDGAASFNQDVSIWDTFNVMDMSNMFLGAISFNQNVSSWNTGNVTDMSGMFGNASNFNQDISNWDTSNVTNMAGMFGNASNFNQDISNWDTSNVTNMAGMFSGAANFNQDLSRWSTENVNDMNRMFKAAINFNGSIGGWNTNNVTNMEEMFNGAVTFNQNISEWDTSNVSNMRRMFLKGSVGNFGFNQNISNWNVDSVVSCANFASKIIVDVEYWPFEFRPNFTNCNY